ncbi:hypothetical protein FRB99_003309 [Tulasnella sp. 403]|nr:hypothetical protein FRB99_003309 [Tulasnella sp. 403]
MDKFMNHLGLSGGTPPGGFSRLPGQGRPGLEPYPPPGPPMPPPGGPFPPYPPYNLAPSPQPGYYVQSPSPPSQLGYIPAPPPPIPSRPGQGSVSPYPPRSPDMERPPLPPREIITGILPSQPPATNVGSRPRPSAYPSSPPVPQPTHGVPRSFPAGALYKPGTYPTPDLFPFPVTKYRLLSHPTSFTSNIIQDALNELGPNSTLYLPKGSRWTVTKTIQLRPHQELATWDYPTEEGDVAWLEADRDCTGHVLTAMNVPGVRIRNIGVDGGREKYGHEKACDCMAFEGGENVRITNNFIGPAGYDEDAETRGKWADGISYAAHNGLVAGNQIVDATDGGIVIFGAPGTLFTSNTVITSRRVALGAINMVDFKPHDGDFLATRVIHNTIRVEGSYLKVGIGQGSTVWFGYDPDKPRNYLSGAVVTHNLITGGSHGCGEGAVGYGFAVSDVRDWVCTDNEVSASVEFSGDLGTVLKDPRRMNVGPGPFVCSPRDDRLDTGPKNSQLQPEFAAGPITHLIGIKPGRSHCRMFWPGQFSLGVGQVIKLNKIELGFDQDGEIRLREVAQKDAPVRSGGKVLWTARSREYLEGRPGAKLTLDPMSGKLVVLDGGDLVFDLTPSVIFHPPRGPDPRRDNVDKVLAISDEAPQLVLTSSATAAVDFAPLGYQAVHQWQAKQSTYVCQTTADGEHTLLGMMNPFGQYVILRTVVGHEAKGPLPPKWPVDTRTWTVLWKSHEVDERKGEDPESYIIFQADGNLVIYSGKERRPLWAADSRRPTPTRTDDGTIVWSTNGKTVG